MARIRSIKPEAFIDDVLGTLPPVCRWFFTGLWTQADRDGRLEDRPIPLKLQIIPYDPESGEWCLEKLAAVHLIVRYRVGGRGYIWIPNLQKHQKFHRDEKPRGLPSPPEEIVAAYETRDSIVLAPCQHPADTLPAPSQHPASTPVNGNLLTVNCERDTGVRGDAPPALAAVTAPHPPPESTQPGELIQLRTEAKARPETLQELWNATAATPLPRCKELKGKRRQRAVAALRERDLGSWAEIIQGINASPFCLGQNERGWTAAFDWLIQPGVAAKVLEGTYGYRGTGPPTKGRASEADRDWTRPKDWETDENGEVVL